MSKLLLLGDEAIAQGAIDGGISGIYAYPGTPSTEITEYVQKSKIAKEKKIHSQWSANEKTAMESALGMSYAGKRAMVCMKHVGLNVAADPFMNSAITGSNGGLIIVVADDPSMHSSQNEQDSRVFSKFAMIPVFEPMDHKEAYEMAYNGFEFSEKYGIPVMIRLTTRLAHSRSSVETMPIKKENEISLPKDKTQFVLLPSIARRNYKVLLKNQINLEKESEESPYNQYFEGKGSDKSFGIIACGITYNYLMENYPDNNLKFPLLKISQYPLPVKKIQKMVNTVGLLLILEDGYPMVEEAIKGIIEHKNSNLKVIGRLSGHIPRDGELDPNIIRKAIPMSNLVKYSVPYIVKNRPPSMCKGCGHIDMYNSLNESMLQYGKGRVFSDIGCYTLGALPPFNAINSCVDMGASITMAKGAADAGLIPSVAVIGDSTFTHSGMTGLLDCIIENTPVVIIISDNSTTAMTGGQESHAFGRLENICKGLGVPEEHIRVFVPLKKNHKEMVEIMKEELAYNGVSVLIPRRDCVQILGKKKKK